MIKRCKVNVCRTGLVVYATTALLVGCGSPDGDALKTEVEQQKQQLTELRAETAQQKQTIFELSSKLSALESSVKELTSKPQKVPTASASGQTDLNAIQTAALQKAIVQCVQNVRALAPAGATPINDVHISFDAFYNPASKRVENNNRYVSQDAVYAFNKCMTEQGWPLH